MHHSCQGVSLIDVLFALAVLPLAAFVIYPNVQAGKQARAEHANLDSTIIKDVEDLSARDVVTFNPGAVDELCVANQNEILVTTR